MIPRIIHSCWFGPTPPPPLAQRCMEGWHRAMPDWTYKTWTAETIPAEWTLVRDLIAQKRYAFASDVARLEAVTAFGGVYLDVDVEVLKPLDPLLTDAQFLGWEREGLASNSICGGIATASYFVACLKAIKAHYAQGRATILAPELCTRVMAEEGPFEGLRVHPRHILFPYNPYDPAQPVKQLMAADITPDTLTIHHWAKQWKLGFFERLRRFLARLTAKRRS